MGAIVALASRYGRYGYRRITDLLRLLDWRVNHKRFTGKPFGADKWLAWWDRRNEDR